MSKKKEKIFFIILVIFSLVTRFSYLNYPKEVVFDEVHFFNYVKNYHLKKNFYLLHPPLGMLTIAFMGWLFDFNFKENSVSFIGDLYKDNVFWLRFVPALFGALLVPLVFLFLKKLTHSSKTAILGGLFVLFDNALLTQSRFILLDSQLVFFIIFSLFSFFSWLESKKWWWLILTGLSSGMAISVKWTGASTLLAIGIYLFYDWLKKKDFSYHRLVSFLKNFLLIFLLAFTIYTLTLYLHFFLLKENAQKEKFFLEGFINLNREIHNNLVGVTSRHPDESKWYHWIFGQKPIYYWVRGNAKIYLAGNPIIWLGSSLAVFLSFLYLVTERKLLFLHQDFLFIAYFSNFFPFFFIKRCLFLYHYLPALVIAIFILAILVNKYLTKEIVFLSIILIVLFLFFYLSPVSYGQEVSPVRMENIQMLMNPFQ